MRTGSARPPLAGARLVDRAGRAIHVSANRPVPVLQADADTIRALLPKALGPAPDGTAVVPFPAFARALHAYPDCEAALPCRDLAAETIDGLGLAGPARWVKSLTGALRLLR
jgi:Protein of unknown function (DUF2000)